MSAWKSRVALDWRDNKLIPISRAARVGMVIYFVFWRILPEFAAALQFDTQAGDIVVARLFVRVVSDILLLLPFLIFRLAGTPIGWLHPLVLPTLLVIAKGIVTNPLALTTAVTAWLTVPMIPDYDLLAGFSLKDRLSVELKRDSLLLLSQICYLLGFALFSRKVQWIVEKRPFRISQWRFLVLTILCFGFFTIYIEMNGGLVAHFSRLAFGRHLAGEKAGHFLVIIGILPYLLVLWYAVRPPILRQAWFIAFFVMALFAQFAATGSRSNMIVPAIMILAAWMHINHRIPALRMALFGLFVTLLFGLLGELRSSALSNLGVVDFKLLTEFNLKSAAESTTEDRARLNAVSGQISVMHAVPESVPHLYGTTYVSAIAFFIPRTIWPNKPRGGGAHVGAIIYSGMSNTSGYTGAAYPPGGVGEAYWNFGVLGVILVHAFLGLFQRIVLNSFLRMPSDPFRAVVLLVSMIVLVDSSSDSIVEFLQVLILLYLSWIFVRRSGAIPAERL